MDHCFDHSPMDVQLLRDISKVCGACHAPMFTGVAPKLAPNEGSIGVSATFAARRDGALGGFYTRTACWWVSAPDGACPPRALLRRGLPDPGDFAFMLAPEAGPACAAALGAAP